MGLITIGSRYVSSEDKDEKWQENYGRSHGMRMQRRLQQERFLRAELMACDSWAARVMVACVYIVVALEVDLDRVYMLVASSVTLDLSCTAAEASGSPACFH